MQWAKNEIGLDSNQNLSKFSISSLKMALNCLQVPQICCSMKVMMYCRALFLKTIYCIFSDAFAEHYWRYSLCFSANQSLPLFGAIVAREKQCVNLNICGFYKTLSTLNQKLCQIGRWSFLTFWLAINTQTLNKMVALTIWYLCAWC